MKFPLISDIATTSVALIDAKSSVSQALDIMLKENHRNAIILDDDCFRILTVIDILNIKKDIQKIDTELSTLNLAKIPTISKNKNVLDTMQYLSNSIEHICVLNNDKTFYGLVTHTDITSNIDPDTLMDNYKLVDFLKYGRRMKWVCKDVITSDLLEDMNNGVFDNIVVIDDMKPIGILTTKDVMRLLKNNNDLSLSVENYMSSPVDTINKNSSIKEALLFIKQKHYKRVVVVDNDGVLSGIVSQKELISLTYSRWAMLMKEYQAELNEINNMLKSQNKEFEVLASTDPLTGLYNRHKFSELYISSYQAMTQRHNKMSIILLDIDFFKKVNDTYGHNVGDQVLIQISHTLLRTLRNIDIVCRWGGEEFIVLLPTAELEMAITIAEKIRKYIESLNIDIAGQVTASFGISEVKEGETMEDVINRADRALYIAKESGRNCVKTELDKT
ncbi:MAG: diguanylate cyclase [Campylobacterota bacterium]|nr:diguanylate cyclase [Campylobacterota bacterium]